MDIINKSLKLLKKKRPNSAKNAVNDQEKQPVDRTETSNRLHEIFKKFKLSKKKPLEEDKEAESDKQIGFSKPSIGLKSNRNDKNKLRQKSSDSLSERFSQMSPSSTSQAPFSNAKYQKMLK